MVGIPPSNISSGSDGTGNRECLFYLSCLVRWWNHNPILCQLCACTLAADNGGRKTHNCAEGRFMTTRLNETWVLPTKHSSLQPSHFLTFLDNDLTMTFLPPSLQHLLPYPHSQLMTLLPTSWKKVRQSRENFHRLLHPSPALLVSGHADSASPPVTIREPPVLVLLPMCTRPHPTGLSPLQDPLGQISTL